MVGDGFPPRPQKSWWKPCDPTHISPSDEAGETLNYKKNAWQFLPKNFVRCESFETANFLKRADMSMSCLVRPETKRTQASRYPDGVDGEVVWFAADLDTKHSCKKPKILMCCDIFSKPKSKSQSPKRTTGSCWEKRISETSCSSKDASQEEINMEYP